MPTKYEEIRTALDRGFSVDNLRHVNRLCLAAIQEGKAPHPSVLFTVAVIVQWIADGWDEKPILSTTTSRIEKQMKSQLEALLRLGESDSESICSALDQAVKAFATVLRDTLDS